MKAVRNIFIAGCSLVLLSQCASQDDIRILSNQIRAVNQKVEDVRVSKVGTLQKNQASSVGKLDMLSEEVARLKSLLEEKEYQTQLVGQKNSKELLTVQQSFAERLSQAEQELADIKKQIEIISGSIENIQYSRLKEAEERAKRAALKAEMAKNRTTRVANSSPVSAGSVRVLPAATKLRVGTGRVVDVDSGAVANIKTVAEDRKDPAPVVEDSPPVVEENADVEKMESEPPVEVAEDTVFNQAMDAFKSRKYGEAYALFEKSLSENPPQEKIAEILFYMGESRFGMGEHELSVLDYQKVVAGYPQSSFASKALYKQGLAFEKITDYETAKSVYETLLRNYGSSPEAAEAKKRLKDL